MAQPKAGDIMFAKKVELVYGENMGNSMEFTLKTGLKYFGIVLGMYDKKKTQNSPWTKRYRDRSW